MQSRLAKHVTEFGDELYLQISRARDETFSKFPAMKEELQEKQDPR